MFCVGLLILHCDGVTGRCRYMDSCVCSCAFIVNLIISDVPDCGALLLQHVTRLLDRYVGVQICIFQIGCHWDIKKIASIPKISFSPKHSCRDLRTDAKRIF